MAGSHSRCVFHSCKKPSYFSRVIVPFYVSISCEGDFQCLCSSPTLGSLSQENCNVLYKTETPNNFLHLVKHVKCLHENSKLLFSHRRLPTLLLHLPSPTLLLCVPQACDGFLRMSETQSLWLMILILLLGLAYNPSFPHKCLKMLQCNF